MQQLNLARAIYAARGNPLEYPSSMVARPVLVSAGSFEELRPADGFKTFITDDGIDVDDLLKRNGSAPVADRIAQIAFGAHRNMENIAWKLANYSRSANDGFSRDFLMLPGYLANADVVACNISSGGHMYSGLLTTREGLGIRRYLLGTKCPVTILLFDRRQMEAMHTMAGIPTGGEASSRIRCEVATVKAHLDVDVVCEAQTYSVAVPFLSLDGAPIAFTAVSTAGRSGYRSMGQEEMFREINRVIGAEPVMAGVTPIIDTVNRRRRELMKNGPDEAKRIAQDELFSFVRDYLANRYVLKDEDGKVRRGIEDVYDTRAGQAAWRFEPLYRPVEGNN